MLNKTSNYHLGTLFFCVQGKLWKFGYQKGELKGEMFEDTPDAMAEWVAAGRRVAIFSSGSREAKLVT